MKTLIVINEQHSITPNQVILFDSKFGVDGWERYNVPKSGWTNEECYAKAEELVRMETSFVLASPVPMLLLRLGRIFGMVEGGTLTMLDYSTYSFACYKRQHVYKLLQKHPVYLLQRAECNGSLRGESKETMTDDGKEVVIVKTGDEWILTEIEV